MQLPSCSSVALQQSMYLSAVQLPPSSPTALQQPKYLSAVQLPPISSADLLPPSLLGLCVIGERRTLRRATPCFAVCGNAAFGIAAGRSPSFTQPRWPDMACKHGAGARSGKPKAAALTAAARTALEARQRHAASRSCNASASRFRLCFLAAEETLSCLKKGAHVLCTCTPYCPSHVRLYTLYSL
jgi:hypothetical protein